MKDTIIKWIDADHKKPPFDDEILVIYERTGSGNHHIGVGYLQSIDGKGDHYVIYQQESYNDNKVLYWAKQPKITN